MKAFDVIRWLSVALLVTVGLAGCGGVPEQGDGPPPSDASVPDYVADAVPKVEARSRYGNPLSYEVLGKRYYTLKSANGYLQRGIASWYGRKFHGRRTSSGELYDMHAMTAAHKSLPLPTYVRVTNLHNGRSIIARVNDRGPFHDNRLIDLSYSGAKRLGMLAKGTAFVEVKAIDPLTWQAQQRAKVVQADAEVNPEIPTQETTSQPVDALFLQVAAFSLRDNAEQFRSRVHSMSKRRTRVNEVVSNGQKIYRVQVGPIESVAEADRVMELLDQAGFTDLYLVVD